MEGSRPFTGKVKDRLSFCTVESFCDIRTTCRLSGTLLRSNSMSSLVKRIAIPALLPPACCEVRPGKTPTAVAPKLSKIFWMAVAKPLPYARSSTTVAMPHAIPAIVSRVRRRSCRMAETACCTRWRFMSFLKKRCHSDEALEPCHSEERNDDESRFLLPPEKNRWQTAKSLQLFLAQRLHRLQRRRAARRIQTCCNPRNRQRSPSQRRRRSHQLRGIEPVSQIKSGKCRH